MKITYIVGVFPKLSETFVLNQITDLIDAGHEVEIISLTRSDETRMHESVSRYGLLQKTIFMKRNATSIGFEITQELINSLVFTDLIHAHFAAEPTDVALKISRLFSIPFVFTAHAYDIFIAPNKERIREKIEHSASVITISEYNKQHLTSLVGEELGKRIEIIRCGIDLKKFQYRERPPKKDVTILFVGRFVEKKGLSYGIEAFSEVVKEFPSARLRIIGDGALRDELSEKIAELGIGEQVTLLGGQPDEVVRKEMNEADIFLLPSVTAQNGDKEGVPIVLMEAQAMGLPVVSTLHSGIPEVVTHNKSGLLVEEKNSTALADALKTLIADPAKRTSMGKEGRKFIEANYDHLAEMEKLTGLINELTHGKPLITSLTSDQRRLLEGRVRSVAIQLIEYRGDQIRRIDEQLKQYDDRLKQIDNVVNLLHQIKQKEEQAHKTDETVHSIEKLVHIKDEEIRTKRIIIQTKDEELRAKDNIVQAKDEEVKAKDAIIQTKDEEIRTKRIIIQTKDEELHTKDTIIQTKDTIIQTKDEELRTKRTIIQAKDEVLQKKEEMIQLKEKELSVKEHLLEEKDRFLTEHRTTILQQDIKLQQREQTIQNLHRDLQKKHEEVLHYKGWLESITNSFPYKVFSLIIRPIRDLLKKKTSEVNATPGDKVGIHAQTSTRNTIVFLPDWSSANPYQKLMYSAVEKNGFPCMGLQGTHFTFDWLWQNRTSISILHFHWIFGVYDPANTGITAKKALIFTLKLVAARLLGYRIFWTIHNLISHESAKPKLEILLRKFVARICERLLVHCNHAKERIIEEWNVPAHKVTIVPHGTYDGYYQNSITRATACRQLGISEHFTFLYFGLVREYKGIEPLITAFQAIYQAHPDVQLVIAGKPSNETIKRKFEILSAKAPIRLFLKFIPDDEVQLFFQCANVVVLPYTNILTSGSSLLALSFGKPVVAPHKGCLPELINDRVGILYQEHESLVSTLVKAKERFENKEHSEEIYRIVSGLRWDTIIQEQYLPLITTKK